MMVMMLVSMMYSALVVTSTLHRFSSLKHQLPQVIVAQCCHLLCCPHHVPVARLWPWYGEGVIVVARVGGVCCELCQGLSLHDWQHLWWQLPSCRRHQGEAAVLGPAGHKNSVDS